MRKIDRFDMYMQMKGLNDNKVTIDLNLSTGILNKSRKNSDLSEKTIKKILDYYTDLSEEWLIVGSGEMLKNFENNSILSSEPPTEYPSTTEKQAKEAPLIPTYITKNGKISIENYISKVKNADMKNPCDFLPEFDYIIRETKSFMLPAIVPGDILFLKHIQLEKAFLGSTYVFDTMTHEGSMCRKLLQINDNKVLLGCYNREFNNTEIDLSEIYDVYKIVGILKHEPYLEANAQCLYDIALKEVEANNILVKMLRDKQ